MRQKSGDWDPGFEEIITKNLFYADKTDFIREWWECGDKVNLIAKRKFASYWENASTNSPMGKLVREGAPSVKMSVGVGPLNAQSQSASATALSLG